MNILNSPLRNLIQTNELLKQILLEFSGRYGELEQSLDSSVEILDKLCIQKLDGLTGNRGQPVSVKIGPLDISLRKSLSLTRLYHLCEGYRDEISKVYDGKTNMIKNLTQEKCVQIVVDSVLSSYKRVPKYKKDKAVRFGQLLYKLIPLAVELDTIQTQYNLKNLEIKLQNPISVLLVRTRGVDVFQLQHPVCIFSDSDLVKIRGTVNKPITYGESSVLDEDLSVYEDEDIIFITPNSLKGLDGDYSTLLEMSQQDIQTLKEQMNLYLQNLKQAISEFQDLAHSLIEAEFSDLVISQYL